MHKIITILFSVFISTPGIASDLVMETVTINNRQAEELQSILNPLLEGSEQIIANRSLLIIRATPARQKELKNLIEQLDTSLTNLSITVIQSKTKTAHGLNHSIQSRLHYQDHEPSGISIKTRGHFANTDSLNNTESRQQIQTVDGKPAFIKTGKLYPVNNISVYQTDYGHPVISSNTRLIEATTGFLVTPRLSKNQVTLEIAPWSDKMQNNGTLSTQSGHTTLRINLGQWVEIGEVREQSQLSANRILSHRYSTKNQDMKIFIKVDKIK